jgi:hypothetical protein
MPEQAAGELRAGASRTYEFIATLPDGAPSEQNALQKASTTVAYAWNASEASGEEATEEERRKKCRAKEPVVVASRVSARRLD